jgi:hypothetical protein
LLKISVGTVASQLLYEIQGPQYYGSDVVAVLEGIQMTQEGKDRVRVSGIKGNPPPTTTKVGMTAKGGYQAQFSFYLCGLDLEQKAEWTKVSSQGLLPILLLTTSSDKFCTPWART